MIIAIDGGVASGKSAVGRRVAERLGLPFIDSGLMYRAITRLAAERGIDPRDSDAVTSLAESTVIRVEGERVWADGTELTDGIYDTGPVLVGHLRRIDRAAGRAALAGLPVGRVDARAVDPHADLSGPGLGHRPIDEREDTPDGVLVVARLPRRELHRFAPYLVAEAHRESA